MARFIAISTSRSRTAVARLAPASACAVKAALAGAFVIHEVKEMVTFAEADKTLCKIVPNIGGAKSAMGGLISKLKGGSASASDLESVNSVFDSVKSQAGSLGAGITDKNVKIPGL